MKNLPIEELIVAVNKLAMTGSTLTEIELQLGLGKKSLSKKLSKGYRFDRSLKQYVPKEVIAGYGVTNAMQIIEEEPKKEVVTDLVIHSYQEESKPILEEELEKELVTTVVTEVVTKQETQEYQGFKGDEVEIIYKLIEEYRIKQKLQDRDEEAEDKADLSNRNIRVYTKQYNKFANWCKTNNVTQADALYKAINLLMNS